MGSAGHGKRWAWAALGMGCQPSGSCIMSLPGSHGAVCPAEHQQGLARLGKATALGLAGLSHGGPRWPSTGRTKPGSARCQPQTVLPTVSSFAVARDAPVSTAGPAVLLAGIWVAMVGSRWGRSCARGRRLGGLVCPSARQDFQSLSSAAWHSRAAAIPRALALPKPDARVTLGLPSTTSPVLCWHVFHRCLQAPN